MNTSSRLRGFSWVAGGLFWACLFLGLDSKSPYSVVLISSAGVAGCVYLLLGVLLWRADRRTHE